MDIEALSLREGKICRATDYKRLEREVLIESSKAKANKVTNLKEIEEEKSSPSGRLQVLSRGKDGQESQRRHQEVFS